MKKIILTLVASLVFSVTAHANDYLYKSPNKIDYVKLSDASKDEKGEKEGGLKHPATFTPEQMRAILKSLHFNKKVILSKKISDGDLFREGHVEFLLPYLIEGFQKAKDDQVVVLSFFTKDATLVIQDDRLTIIRAFVKEDGLHFKFNKLYAKMLGDRTTMGAQRAAQEAKSLGVSLEIQPGQNRIAWEPEELVFDLNHFTASGEQKTEPVEAKGKDKKSSKAAAKEAEAQETVKKEEKKVEAAKIESSKSIKDRLKELEQLKKDELITDKEYQEKRKDLLKQL
ncbi:MAG: hypothetical protein IPJ69_09565 [Deltaproteobacteria bacterium]|nr:MAG: hypothetical protein IPJ69_09565 [Deltaproteobacteria bacterium]